MLLLKISLRNLIRHKGKTTVIGLILFIGGITLALGGGTVTSMQKNVTQTLVDNFFGNITIMSSQQIEENVMDKYFGDGLALVNDVPKIKKNPRYRKRCDKLSTLRLTLFNDALWRK